MKDYLNSVLNRCNAVCDLAYNIIEEVNDGSQRSALVLSSIEAVYCLQDMVRAYLKRYPSEFEDMKLYRKAVKFIHRSPDSYLRSKFHRMNFQNESCEIDDLPF